MEKVKWGIMGSGKIARKLALAINSVEEAELYAVGSRSLNSSKSFASEFGVKQAYGSYEELVADPEVSVIYVATPHAMHYSNTMLALRNGKHVLCEKAFAINEEEVRSMVDMAKSRGLFLMEAMWSRFHPSTCKVLELIDSGAIGKVLHIRSDFAFKAEVDLNGRLFNPSLGGGSLLDIGIYPVFIALLILGEPDNVISTAVLTPEGIDSSISAIFGYKSGAIANLFASFLCNSTTETEITGTEGRIIMHRKWFMPNPVTLITDNGAEHHFEFDVKCNGYESEVEEVCQCVRNGQTESSKMPHEMSLKLIRLLDLVRKQNGIVYGNDKS